VVLERAESEPGLYGMGTTLVALLLGAGAGASPALIAHAGDSRCYSAAQGEAPEDHTRPFAGG